MKRNPRQHDEAHLAFIRQLPCLITGENTTVEACHIRFSDARIAKVNAGVGAKPHDMFTVPLSGAVHRQQHSRGERQFWQQIGIDPVLYALALYAVSGDHERGCQIVASAHATNNILAAG